MQTREISHNAWELFFDDFTRLHHDERIKVETMGEGGFGIKSALVNLPLVGIAVAAHAAATPINDEEWIEVIARDLGGSLTTHTIAKPLNVRLGEEHGRAVAVQVESSDGSITMIRFEPPRENMPVGFTVS